VLRLSLTNQSNWVSKHSDGVVTIACTKHFPIESSSHVSKVIPRYALNECFNWLNYERYIIIILIIAIIIQHSAITR